MLHLHYSYVPFVAGNMEILRFLILVLALFYRNMFECFLFTSGELQYKKPLVHLLPGCAITTRSTYSRMSGRSAVIYKTYYFLPQNCLLLNFLVCNFSS